MIDDSRLYQRLSLAVCASLVIQAAGCKADAPATDEPTVFSTRASRGSTIALSEDDARVAMVNPDDGSLSVFQTADHARISKLATGGNPSSVVIAPDGKTAYVANRADGTVVRIADIDGGTPAITATVGVGAEPAGLALSPSGRQLFVAEYAQSRVAVIDTRQMAITATIAIDRPRALAVTNNGDHDDADERLVVAQFFGVPVPGREAKDDGRTGRVVTLALADLTRTSWCA